MKEHSLLAFAVDRRFQHPGIPQIPRGLQGTMIPSNRIRRGVNRDLIHGRASFHANHGISRTLRKPVAFYNYKYEKNRLPARAWRSRVSVPPGR
jgi:hypothetical protein